MSKLSTEQRNQLTDSDFGIPEKRMYPLHDKAHVESAVKLFGHAETKYKKSLARKILSRAREYGMDTSGWKQVLTFAQEQVPPMSNGTSIGNSPPRLMAPYYDEQDELLERVNDLDGAVDPFVFAKRIVSAIHDQVEKDSKPPTGNQNCQLCTWCAEAWYRNMQVLPRPVYSPRDPALEIKGETIVANPIKKRFSSQREVVETVRGNVDSRWYVHVNWKDSTGGHEFLVVNINDYAYIMDAQAGMLKEIDETDSTHNYFRDINFKNSYMARLDNKQFNVKLFNEMNDPSKVMPWKNSLDIPYMRDNGMLAPGDDSDPRFRRVLVPSDEALKYLKEDPELSQYWEDLMKATKGEFLIDRETGEPIGHVFVHTNKKDKGFIFNLEVNPKYRRQGYGWILTDDAVRRFGGEDLTVDADNEPAIQLYLQYGFEIYKKGQWHYDPPKDEYWMKLKASKRPKPVQEAFTDYQEAFDALFILEAEAANQGVLAKIIDWCKRAIQFIISKVKGLFGVKDPVKTNVDINALNQQTHSTMDQVENGQPVDINKLDQQLATFKNPCEIKNVQEAVKQINANIELINKALNKEGLDQQTATALQKLLTAYMTALKDIQNNQQASQGNKTIIEELKKSILTNNESGSSNIQVYPYLYSRTYYIDFDVIGLVFPTELIKNTSDASKYVLKCVESFGHPAQPQFNSSVTYYNGFYTVLIHCLAEQLAEKVGYKPETFTAKRGETRKKFLNDVVGRSMQIYIGYIVSAEEIKKNGIPAVSYQMLWNIYLKAQEHSFFVPEGNVVDENKKRRIPSSLVTVKSNPMSDIKPVQEGDFQESTNVFESGHFSKYKDDVLGFNDEGMAVMKKCDCGGKISIAMKGEPVYICESCGKYYGTVPCNIQEGAFQDLKNGVNPYSDKMVFHVSPDKHIDGQVWKPRVPDYLDPYNPEDTGFEDNTTPRICFSTSIEGALNGITVNLQRQSPDTFDKMYVYVPEKPWKEYKHKTNKQLVKDKLVYDANVTREVWIMEPVRMKLYGVIRVDQIADAKRKSVVPTSKGQKDTRNYFTYKWHWVVKPKVLKKATKFDYSPEHVIDDLCVDVKKFKYGLIKDGRLMTGNVSDADYDKYWVFHSGETVDQAGGGNCYDMVEYEAGYLDAFGVPYKKYYMNFTNTKNTKTINTHTICVVPHNGKFIYIEQAFKRVVDEWGYERKKVFDKLTDIFEYVAEVTAEYENQDLNYGVWDYTNAEIDYGTPIKNFMEWIMSKCKMIRDGEATKLKPTKESYEMYDYDDDDDIIEESAMDMFIELGDMMFYVSEYHNALFDDPDAHDEVINEYGILLDSYDDEFIEETAKPYDDYLRKHGYDPKTNSIEDPNNPGRRVNAGRIGSKKERNRMNKFLRENGYDPKTETILTDINDKNNPGQKKRVKFGINSAIGNAGARMTMPPAYSRVDDVDDYTDDTESGIAMSKSTMQQKPGQSNYILKHEEGHMAYEDSFDKKRNGTWNNNPSHHSPKAYRDDINAARQHIKSQAKKNPALLGNSHDILPTEYQADKYGEEHNRYGRGHGAAALTNVIGKLKKFDPSTYQAQRKAMLDAYGTGEEGFKKFAASLQDNYDMMLSMAEMMKGTPSASAYKKGLVGIKREIDAGFPESRKVFFSLTQPDEKKAIDEGIQRDIDKMDAGTNSRIAFMKKYADKAQVQQAAADAKRRQLAKEQLKQQIASGKLTGDQAAKAERKIQRIEAFEAGKQQMQQPPKQQTQPQPKQDTISVGKQSISKPTVKKEGYRMNRFGRFYTEAKNEEELLSDDMEDITIGDLELDDDKSDDTKDEKISIKDTNIDDDGSLPEEGDFDQYRDDDDDERIEKARGPIDDVPEYLKDRLSDDDLKDFEQPDENLNADNVDLGQFGTDQSDVQNDFDPKEVTILMKLMASEADAMNEYMDGAKETNVDVLRRLYADIANEERFHMEQLLFAKCELTGEQYQPKDPEVKSEYEELLKMGMDEETAMQTAVDKCHIRGSISEDDEDERMEIQADVETMEMTINMFNQLYDNVYTVMESGTPKEVDHAFEIFVEATYDATAASSAQSALSETKKFGPIQLIRTTLRFLVKTLMTIVRKFVSLCKRIHNRSREIKRFIKQYGFEAIFSSKIKMYFVNFNNPYLIDDSLETLLALSVDTVNASLRSVGFQEMQQPYKRNPRMNVGGNVKRGIELLNGVQLVKSAMVLPENESDRERIAEAFFGYSDQKGPDGKSINTVNRMQLICDEWCRFMEYVDKITTQFDSLAQQQQSVYYTNKAKYDVAMKGLETVTKTCKAVVSAMQYDIETMIKLNNDAATQSANMADTAAKDDQYNKQKQAYEQSHLVTTQCPFCGKTIKGQPDLLDQELMKHVKTSHSDIPNADWVVNNMRKKNKS